MSCEYKFYNAEGLYFATFATVARTDVFARKTLIKATAENYREAQKNGS